MNEARSVAEEYGFGKNSEGKPAGTGIIMANIIVSIFVKKKYNTNLYIFGD